VLCGKVAVSEAPGAMLGRSFAIFVAVMGVRSIRGAPVILPVRAVLMVMVFVSVFRMVLARMVFVLDTVMVVAQSAMKRQVHHRHDLEAAEPKQASAYGSPLAAASSRMPEVHNRRRLAASFCSIN